MLKRRGELTHSCRCYLHSSHTGSSYCDLDVLMVSAVFFMSVNIVQRQKKADVEGRVYTKTVCPCTRAHTPVWIVHSLTGGFTSRLQQQDWPTFHRRTHRQTRMHRGIYTHSSVSSTVLFWSEWKKPLKKHLDQRGTLKFPTEAQSENICSTGCSGMSTLPFRVNFTCLMGNSGIHTFTHAHT